jgi:hypothetical protein
VIIMMAASQHGPCSMHGLHVHAQLQQVCDNTGFSHF